MANNKEKLKMEGNQIMPNIIAQINLFSPFGRSVLVVSAQRLCPLVNSVCLKKLAPV
jgi:hypothetical protein